MRRKVKPKKTKYIIIILILFALVISISIANKATSGEITRNIINTAKMKLFKTGFETYPDVSRKKLNFNYDWEFSKGEGKNNSQSDLTEETITVISDTNSEAIFNNTYVKGSSGETWQEVSLPHTFNDIDTFDNFMESKQNGERSMYTGTSWYTKDFTIPEEYRGKRIYIEFEAARQAAKISLNGVELEGTSESGFIPFGYDLTPHINFGGLNKITVMVDNTFPYVAEGTTSELPWHDSHWQPSMGGLYRNSYLYVVEPVHLTMPLYSFLETEGTYIYTSNETKTTAQINVDAEVYNSQTTSKNIKLIAYVKKQNGDVALTIESDNVMISANTKTKIKISDTLNNAIRWSDVYPYVYTVVCKIIDTDTNTVIDNNENPLGIRTFKFTNDYGLYLNGNYVKLQGWGQKPTNEWAGLGSAYPDWMQDYVMKKMKDAGGNFVRWGHCAGGPTSIAASDKYGIITLQPGVEAEGNYGDIKYTKDSYQIRAHAFRDMLIYYRNNPSILLWEIGNQTIKDKKTVEEMTSYIQRYDYGNRTYETNNAQGDFTFNSTQNIKNSGTWEDSISSSARLAGTRQGDSSMKPYVGVGVTTEGKSSMNNSSSGNKPEVEGEYNRLEARRGVWDLKTPGYENFSNKLGSTVTGSTTTLYGVVTSEEFAKYQIKSYEDMIGDISHCGGANWIFSDSTSHGRVISETSRVSGEVDATMLEKESYWVNKVMFSNTAGAHIIGHWNYPDNTVKDIYVVGNGGETQLAKAVLKIKDLENNITTYNSQKTYGCLWTFQDVQYKEGTISVEFMDEFSNVVISASKTSHKEPHAMRITPVNVGQTLYANGSDILLLDVEIIDEDGNRCNTFDGVRDNITTYFTLNNQSNVEFKDNYSQWRGGYNSSIEDSTNNKFLKIESGIARIAVKTTLEAGEISVRAQTTIDGKLTQTQYTTSSVPIDNTNGYSLLENYTPIYDLTQLTNPGVGDEEKPLNPDKVSQQYSSGLIEDFSYTGTTTQKPTFSNILENNAIIYNDTSTKFTSVPYKYQNAEYFKLPSIDNSTLAVDLISFIPIQDIDVLVFRDPDTPNPKWLTSEFTKTTDIVTGSNGVIYDVYKKSAQAGIRITLGSNGEDAQAGSKGWMNIIAVKETSKINNSIFLDEEFQIIDIDNSTEENRIYKPSILGWNLVTTGQDISFSSEIKDNENTSRLIDNNLSAMGYIYKKFAKVENKFKATFRINVNDISGTNDFIRLFLNNGVPSSDITDLSKVINQTYLRNTYLKNKVGENEYSIKSEISNNSWHTIEMEFDLKTKENNKYKYEVTVDGVPTGNKYTVNSNDNITADHILVSTGNAHKNDVYISNLKIEPIANDAITGIKINNNNIKDFNSFTKHYKEKVSTNTNEVTIERGEEYKSSSIIYAQDNTYADIIVTDISNTTYEYRIYFEVAIANKTVLKSIISEIEGMDFSKYTSQSFNSLIQEKEKAKLTIKNSDASFAQISNGITILTKKIDELILK